MLLVFSAFADSSPYVLREIERAVAYKRPVLALRIDDVVPSASIEYYVNVWRKFDATTGVEKKQEEIITAVREAIAAPTSGGGSRPRGAKGASTSGSWSRRKWWIAFGSLLAIAAIGLGLGFGLTRDHAASGAGLMRDEVTWTKPNPPGALPLARATQEMVQDPTSGRLIMFGGYAGKDGGDRSQRHLGLRSRRQHLDRAQARGRAAICACGLLDGLRSGHPKADHVRRA